MPLDPGSTSIPEFHAKLQNSKRIIALCGAGLSATSGLPTYRVSKGSQGLWTNERADFLASAEAFEKEPDQTWLFFSHRRHEVLRAQPNAGHVALAKLAKGNKEFLCLTQNVDGLSQRAGHPTDQIHTLHGSLMDLPCNDPKCDYIQRNNFDDPLCPALKSASQDLDRGLLSMPLLQPDHVITRIPEEELLHCPKCGTLLRPGVVRFREDLDGKMLGDIREWIDEKKVDLMLVIGTGAEVWPAAGFVVQARKQGAALAVVNLSTENLGSARDLKMGDFYFIGDATELLPKLLEPISQKSEE
ncbi:DHS-like NAD/FAD-binding domain-containing protein [Xylariaceae sp. FL1019]|nr:DHS-like NAD/FAD-binding domain-containing protein [Xylariaceae sp. FL1019]